jgi:integrase
VKRRGKAEGSIYRRGDGLWVGALHLGYRDGKRARKLVYGQSQADVIEKLGALRQAASNGTIVEGPRQLVGPFLARWLSDVVRPSVRPRTYVSYEQIVRVHLTPGLGKATLATLSPLMVQEFLNRRAATGLSPQTVSYTRSVLRNALGTAERWGLVVRNAAALASAPKVERRTSAFLSPAEGRRLIDALKDESVGPLVVVALATGLRQGELLGLRWQDVVLDPIDQATVTVCRQMSRIHGKAVATEPKTSGSRRVVSLAPFAVDALRQQRAHQAEERLLAGSRWVDLDLVFATTKGTPMDPARVTRALHRATARAELPRVRFHDLRHSCASIMAAEGVQPRVAMEILGHSDVRTTLSIYTHALPELRVAAAARIQDALGTRAG